MASYIDFNLLKFNSYDEYLDSYIHTNDYRYLGSIIAIKKLVKLGYRSSSKLYEESEFNKLRAQLLEHLNPKVLTNVLFSNYMRGDDPALEALKIREESNMLRKLATIIFIQVRQRSGFDISGYIDFEKSLRDCTKKAPERTNWRAVFEGRILLRPKPNDLSYYDWHKGLVFHTDTENFQAIRGGDSLIFKHKGDHKLIPVTAKATRHSDNVIRLLIPSHLYGFIILYDHFIR